MGRATRLIEYVQRMPKRYRARFLLGRRSDTDDIEGVVEELPAPARPSRQELDRAIPQFLGVVQQRPPAHSAVKVAGRRAYDLARRGEAVQLSPRPVTIHRIAVCRYEYPELELEIECGTGTYVRALGRDLAASLGTAAVMSVLERSAIGGFQIGDAVSLEGLTAEMLTQQLQPAIAAVADLPRIELADSQQIEIRHGRPIGAPGDGVDVAKRAAAQTAGSPVEWAAVDTEGRLLAILREKQAGQLWPEKNFL